jgi:hypothetical protein
MVVVLAAGVGWRRCLSLRIRLIGDEGCFHVALVLVPMESTIWKVR